jgi:hypothetical protein
VVDKNNNIVEKKAKILFCTCCCDGTNLSDEELSEKIGITVNFPKTLCEEFSMVNKHREWLGFKSYYYNLWNILKTITLSIHNEEYLRVSKI